MAGFQIQYPTRLKTVDNLPAAGATGDLVFLTSDNNMYVYYDGAWNVLGSATADGTFDFMDGNDLQFMDGTSAAFMSG